MLETPFGNINIYIDDKLTKNYYIIKLKNDEKFCPDLDGRYALVVNFKPDGREHRIECRLEGHAVSEFDGLESGERLLSVGFFSEDFVPENLYGVGNGGKISIAVEYDCEWKFDGTPIDLYDYGADYSESGYVAFKVLDCTKTEEFIFGVAWQNEYDGENAQAWLGSDPTMFDKNMLKYV